MTNTPCRSRNGTTEHQVEIGGTHYWFRAEQLESVPLAESPLDLLAAGSLGDVSDLRRAMTFHRLSGRISNVIYSLDATKTDFLAYQFKPLLKLLNAPNGGLLIADEVGLGKTIEAGLIWTELRARFDARRLLVICPAVLRGKWQRELSLRFGVRAEVVDAHRAHEITRRNIEETTTPEFAMVASFQGLRPSADWEPDETRDLRQHTFIDFIERHSERKLFDLVIIDEAHYGRNRGTGTAKLFHQVRQVSSHIVLLSATPIHLKNSDLFNLLNLIDPGQFSDEEPFDDIVAANRPVMALANRLLMGNATPEDFRSALTDALRNPLLSTSRQLCALLESPPDESEIYSPAERGRLCAKLHETSLLDNVVCRTRKREVVEGRVPREPHAERVTLAPIERGLYNRVTAALKKNAATEGKRQPFLLVMPQRQLASSIPAAFREWLTRGSATVDDDDDDNDTPTPVIDSVISSLGEDFTFSELRAADTKYRRLQSVLNERLRQNPEEKIVLFAFFRPTLTYLSERLREDGIQNIVLMGGANEDNLTKDEILERFSAERGPRVLLSSEVGSEGIDLQFASVLINYDLPWNPMRIEQRIGRIDRKGQAASRIQIWNLVAAETIDERIYSKLYERLGIFTAALGGLEAVLGDLKNTAAELLLSDLSPAEEAERLDQTAYALEQRRREEERLEANSAVLIAHQDYILEQLGASKKLGRAITADDLSLFVRDFFHTHFRGTRIYAHEFGENEVEIILDSNCLLHFEQFARDKGYSLSSSRLFNQSTTPVRCCFDTKIADATPRNTEIINQFHPLIRFIVHTITLEGLHHHPAIAAKVPHSSCNAPSGRYAFIVQRWEIGGTRREERLHFGVIPLNSSTPLPAEDAETLITTAVLKGIPWADSAVENDLVHAAKTVDTLIQSGSAAYDRFFLELEVKRHDQAEIQACACRAVHDREVSRLVAQRERNVGHSARINPAIDGSIARLRRTYEARLAEIQDRRELIREGATELAVGIIEVES